MLYSAIDIANFFVNRALTEKRGLTPMQVVKLTFLAHGWNLGLSGKPLINEPVQAWKFGPVIPSVYFAFQGFGKERIDKAAPQFSFLETKPRIESEDESLLNDVYDLYAKYSGGQLSTLTHKEGSPWEVKVRPFVSKGLELPRFLPIEDELIKDYYGKKAAANRERSANRG